MDFSFLVQLTFAALFIGTSYSKISDWSGFQRTVQQMGRLKSKPVSYLIAGVLFLTELLCGLSLLFSAGVTLSIPILIALLLGFSLIVLVQLRNKVEITCHCGGVLGNEDIHYGIPIRNLILIGMLAALYLFPAGTSLAHMLEQPGTRAHTLIYAVLVYLILTLYYVLRTSRGTLPHPSNSNAPAQEG